MGKYLVIETRSPFGSDEVLGDYETAGGLASRGHEVTLFLTHNGVLAARGTSTAARRLAALGEGTTVLADEFALRARGIGTDELVPGVASADAGRLVDLLLDDGRKAIWR